MDEFIKTLHDLILKHTQSIEEYNALETKKRKQELISLRDESQTFASRQELETQKKLLQHQKSELEDKRSKLEKVQQQEVQEQREQEEKRREGIQQSNQDWLMKCRNKLEKVQHVALQKRIQDVDQWLSEGEKLQSIFGASKIEDVSLKKLQSLQPQLKDIQKDLSTQIDAFIEKKLEKKRSQKSVVTRKKGVEETLHAQHQRQKELIQELRDYGVRQVVIDALLDMDSGAEKYFTEQILETFHSNLSMERNWNQSTSPIRELETYQPE